MKIRHKFMLLTLVAMMALPMFLVGPNGKPVMAIDDWLPEDASLVKMQRKAIKAWNKVGAAIEEKTGVAAIIEPPATPKLYKWKDQFGNWQFANEPPVDVKTEVFVKEMPRLNNVMEPVKVRDRGDGAGAGPGSGFKLAFPATSIPVGDIPKLIDDAKNVQNLADQRQKALESL